MLILVVSLIATGFTVARTWPQFIRIVIRGERKGVSLTTWTLALANHTGWFVYGLLVPIPIFILSNLLAGIGCAATVVVMKSWKAMLAVLVATAAVSAAVYALEPVVLLVAVNCFAVAMFLPQLVRVFRTKPQGVSITAWSMAAMSSVTWMTWGFLDGDPLRIASHFIMLPCSSAIVIRTLLAHNHRPVADVEPAA